MCILNEHGKNCLNFQHKKKKESVLQHWMALEMAECLHKNVCFKWMYKKRYASWMEELSLNLNEIKTIEIAIEYLFSFKWQIKQFFFCSIVCSHFI